MFQVFQADTADDLWCQASRAIDTDLSSQQLGRTGSTRELLRVSFSLSNPRNRWVTSRNPALNIAFALAEVVWIIRGRNDAEFLNFFNRQLPQFAGDTPTYHGAYGRRLVSMAGFNQLHRAYQILKANPSSRQVALQIWSSNIDLPGPDGVPTSQDIPCNLVSMLKVRDGSLEWSQIMRSNDLYMGFPHNVVQFTCLQELIAGWLGLKLGSYYHYSDSLHVYDRDLQKLDESRTEDAPVNSDELTFKFDETERHFTLLESLVARIIDPRCVIADILSFWDAYPSPSPIRNIGVILLCEGLRRKGAFDLTQELLSQCSNPAYVFMYQRWLARVMRATTGGHTLGGT